MAIAFVKEVLNAEVNPVSQTPAVTVAAAPAANNLVVLSCAWNSLTTTLTSVTDSKGNTWTVDNQVASGSTSVSVGIASTTQNAAALTTSDTITFHFSVAVNWLAAVAHEFSGCTNTVDQIASNGAGTLTTRDAGTTPATTNANDLVYAAFAISSTESAFTAGAGFTAPAPGFYTTAGHGAVEFEYQIVAATGAYHPTGTGGLSSASAGVAVAYKAASAGGAGQPPPRRIDISAEIAI